MNFENNTANHEILSDKTIDEIRSVIAQIQELTLGDSRVLMSPGVAERYGSMGVGVSIDDEGTIFVDMDRTVDVDDSLTYDAELFAIRYDGATSRQVEHAANNELFVDIRAHIQEIAEKLDAEKARLVEAGTISDDPEARENAVPFDLMRLPDLYRMAKSDDEDTRDFAQSELISLNETIRSMGDGDDAPVPAEIQTYTDLLAEDTRARTLAMSYLGEFTINKMQSFADAYRNAKGFRAEDSMSEQEGLRLLSELDQILVGAKKYRDDLMGA